MTLIPIKYGNSQVIIKLKENVRLLKEYAAVIHSQAEEIKAKWLHSYTATFGEKAFLKEGNKSRVLGKWFDLFSKGLAGENMQPHYAEMTELGKEFFLRGVPLEEIILSLHLLEEVTFPILIKSYPDKSKLAKIQLAADLLFHNELSCLSLAYFYMYKSEIERLEKLQDDLTHMIVHDLKNPISTVTIASSSLIEDFKKSGKIDSSLYLELINRAGSNLWKMVNNLLDIDRLEKGVFTLRAKPEKIETVLDEVLKENQPYFDLKNIRLVLHKTAAPEICFDRNLIKRTINNLLDNAIKYSPEKGKITIELKTRNKELAFSIKDEGPGIKKTDIEKIFEKFAQAGLALQGVVHGTGLGLTFCKMAVEASKGRINVRSKEGKGATFTFTLPLHS